MGFMDYQLWSKKREHLIFHRMGKLLNLKLQGVGSLYGADLEAVREDVALLAKQVNTCSAIARRYLRFVSKRSATAHEVSVNQVLDDVQTLMRNHPSIRGGHLAIKHLDVDTAAQISGTELIQILLNLCVNAFQSTEKSQTVWVTAERFDIKLPTETFEDNFDERFLGLDTCANQPPLIAISVLDQGPGIPRDVLPRVFEPYYTTKTQTGTCKGPRDAICYVDFSNPVPMPESAPSTPPKQPVPVPKN